MSRYDKYDPISGGFRAEAAENFDTENLSFGTVYGAGINNAGKVLVHAVGQTGPTGVTIVERTRRRQGDVLDIMTDGEIVKDSTEAQWAAGTVYYLDADGDLTDVPSRYRVGHTVEPWRLVVRFTDLGAVPA